jgi:hypothetical protein
MNPSHESLRRAREFISQENGIVAPMPFSEEELDPELQDDLSFQAHPLEPTTTTFGVGYSFPEDSEKTEFAFFEDGKQRTVQIGYIPTVMRDTQIIIPVHYFVIAAVILKRHEKNLSLWQEAIIRQGILVDKSLVPNQVILKAFENAGLEVIDTQRTDADYYALKKQALRKSKDLRLETEEQLISTWRTKNADSGHFLVVDGTLMNLRDEESIKHCIGVSKSFHSRYFELSAHSRIMQLPEFHRSWTFRFHDPEGPTSDQRMGSRERVSWYLRLRSRPQTDPEFGLIRVEISKHYSAKSTEYADRFSRSLLSERLPTTYSAPRWHNHLFPICECESYLNSVIPSISTINASMKG